MGDYWSMAGPETDEAAHAKVSERLLMSLEDIVRPTTIQVRLENIDSIQ